MSQGVFTADPVQVTGNDQNAAMDIPVHYDMNLRYNGRNVPANKRSLYLFHWYGQNLRSGQIVDFGCGPVLDFVPNQHGFNYPEGFAVWANVLALLSFGVVTDDSDNKYVAESDGKLVISGIYG